MKTWIGSDFHWGHKNIMNFCPDTRGHYRDIHHMNQDMIDQWNNMVAPEDLVYMLGDIAFMNGFEASKIVNRLSGRKILIKGNHDSKIIKDVNFKNSFEEIHDYLVVNYNKHRVVMFHYPISEWDQMHRGSIHFYGHLHQNKSGLENYRARNVGWDCTGKILSSMEEMIEDALKGVIKSHHGKYEM